MSDDPWDDWETAADAGLSDNVKKIVPPSGASMPLEEQNKKIWLEANKHSSPIIIRTAGERTEYKPELKILKRPTNTSSDTSLKAPTPPKPKQSLKDREDAYLAARQRIFGEEK